MTIILPPRHEGREATVKKRETEELVSSSNQTTQSFSMEGSNIESRLVKPIYMWALLCAVYPHPDAPDMLRPLRHTLRRWLTNDRGPRSQEVIYSPLKGEYDHMESVSKRRLILEDLHRVNQLRDVSDKIPFEIFFALVSKKRDYDLPIELPKREAYIYGLNGHQITNPRIFVDEKDLVPHTDHEYTASHSRFSYLIAKLIVSRLLLLFPAIQSRLSFTAKSLWMLSSRCGLTMLELV